MNNKFELINMLIDKFGYKSYLEIGVYNPENCFDHIKAEHKAGVDPEPLGARDGVVQKTSDDFFAQNTQTFDIVFIDGLHHDDQVERDMTNSLKFLNPNGTIVVHDCNPMEEQHQVVPAVVPYWCGTVWKAWVRMRQKLSGSLEMFVVNFDTGIGIMKRGKSYPIAAILEEDLTFQNLDKYREQWLNMISAEQFLQWLEGPKDGQETTKAEEQGKEEQGKEEPKKGQRKKQRK